MLYVVSASAELCFVLSPRAWNCNVLHKRGIVCFMWPPQARNCVLCIVSTSVELYVMYSASVELCALCGLRKHGIVYFVLFPRAWNCNVLRKSGINSMLCIVSTSMEL